MRLINTDKITFEEFEGSDIPEYAILSHRWQEEEVLYKDLKKGRNLEKKGWGKIRKCCYLAKSSGHDYVWIDTCCIDKSSSAELTEAINSMYQWYERSAVCYAYLYDVKSDYSGWKSLDWMARLASMASQRRNPWSDTHPWTGVAKIVADMICASEWFTRGWTLQELIAPLQLVFLNDTWEIIGDRSAFCYELSIRTSIPITVLLNQSRNPGTIGDASITSFAIAQRMSWAADRVTTRVEDRAYSLMGLFGVNMPLLYGEGHNAFRRLQEEIVRQTEDDSFLLFDPTDDCSIFAASPENFTSSRNEGFYSDASLSFAGIEESALIMEAPDSFSLTNVGLTIRRPVFLWDKMFQVYVVELQIRSKDNKTIYIFVQFDSFKKRFHRVKWNKQSILYGPPPASPSSQSARIQPHLSHLLIGKRGHNDIIMPGCGQYDQGYNDYLSRDPPRAPKLLAISDRSESSGRFDTEIITRLLYPSQDAKTEFLALSDRSELQGIARYFSITHPKRAYYMFFGYTTETGSFLVTSTEFPSIGCNFEAASRASEISDSTGIPEGGAESNMTRALNPYLWYADHSDEAPDALCKQIECFAQKPSKYVMCNDDVVNYQTPLQPGPGRLTRHCRRGYLQSQPTSIPSVSVIPFVTDFICEFHFVRPGQILKIDHYGIQAGYCDANQLKLNGYCQDCARTPQRSWPG